MRRAGQWPLKKASSGCCLRAAAHDRPVYARVPSGVSTPKRVRWASRAFEDATLSISCCVGLKEDRRRGAGDLWQGPVDRTATDAGGRGAGGVLALPSLESEGQTAPCRWRVIARIRYAVGRRESLLVQGGLRMQGLVPSWLSSNAGLSCGRYGTLAISTCVHRLGQGDAGRVWSFGSTRRHPPAAGRAGSSPRRQDAVAAVSAWKDPCSLSSSAFETPSASTSRLVALTPDRIAA